MTYTFRLPEFEGPLDLLLRLIERAELDITTIALAQVADEYLSHVRALDNPDPVALSEFLVIAARLLLIKSRALLPRPTNTGTTLAPDEVAEELATQLRLYQQYKRAAASLRRWSDGERRVFVRQAPPPAVELPEQDLDVSVAELVAAVQRRLQLMLPLEEPATPLSLPPRLTVRQAGERLRERLQRQPWCSFDDLLSLTVTRQEVIVTLWAVLELLKRGVILVEQPGLFASIAIGRGPSFTTLPATLED